MDKDLYRQFYFCHHIELLKTLSIYFIDIIVLLGGMNNY